MYVNSPLGKTPKWMRNIDRSVRDAGKYVDKSARRVAEDVSAQHARNLKKVNLDNKTPKFIKRALPAATAAVGYIYGGPIAAAGGAIQGKYRVDGKGAPGSIEREKYHERIKRTQQYTRVGIGAALAVVGGAAAYGAYGAGAGGAAGGAGAGAAGTGAGGAGAGAAVTAGRIGTALTTAATVGDKINDLLDPFNPDAVANVPPGASASTNTNSIPWIPLAIAAGFLFL